MAAESYIEPPKSERHVFVGRIPDEVMAGDEIMIEEFVHEDGTRSLTFALRATPAHVWERPHPLEQRV